MSNDGNTSQAENERLDNPGDAPGEGVSDAPGVEGAAPADEAGQGAAAGGQPTVESLQAEIAAMRDQTLRAVADADNTRKRAEREIADARVYSVASFARDLLSVGDNLARALDALSPEMRANMGEAGKTLLAGIEMTQKELLAVLQRHGVSPISAEPGAPFDPNLHQAATQVPSSHPSGAIAQEIQSGWKIGDRVLRAAMVAVSAGGGAPGQGGGQSGVQGGGQGGDADGRRGGAVDTTA